MPPKKKKGAEEEVASKDTKKGSKKDQAPPSRDERASALMDHVNEKMKGRAKLIRASEYRLPYLTKRLPTGLLSIDVALRGGWPAGGVSQLIGRKNAGKTMLMWMTIRQLQFFLGKKMRVLLAMTELPADRQQARLLGVQISMGDADIDAMNKARKDKDWPELTKEEVAHLKQEIGTIHELHALTAEDFYDVVLRAIDEDTYDLVAVDSIGNLLSAAEEENKSIHDKTYGGTSGPNTTFLKKMTNMLTMETEYGEVRDTCILGINQVRDNIKDPNKKYKAPGGNALEHAKLVDLYVESGGLIGEESSIYTVTSEGLKSANRFQAYAKQINWSIEKGKAGIHEGARGSYVYDFRIDNVDYYTDTLMVGVQNGIVKQEGSWLGIPNPQKAGEYLLRMQGKDKFIQALEADALAKAAADNSENSAMNYIRNEVFRKLDINISYDWDS